MQPSDMCLTMELHSLDIFNRDIKMNSQEKKFQVILLDSEGSFCFVVSIY